MSFVESHADRTLLQDAKKLIGTKCIKCGRVELSTPATCRKCGVVYMTITRLKGNIFEGMFIFEPLAEELQNGRK